MAWYNSSWSRRVSVVVSINKTIARVDLSNLSASGFFDYVKNGGGDIRVTKSDGTTEVARDVRSCNTSTNEGWLVFNTGESKSATTATYYIYIGNAAASDYATTDTYGRHNTYDSEHVIVYGMDEDPSGSAPQMTDRSGSGYHGTTGGTMTSGDLVTGQIDSAINFDGTNDQITSSPTFPTGSFSAYCLAKLSSLPSAFKSMSGIDHSNTGSLALFYLQIHSSNNWNAVVTNTSGTGFAATDPSTATTGSFQFVGISYDDTSKVVSLNVNGDERDTATLTGTRATATGSLAVGAAYFAGALADYFPGDIDEYVLMNVALTEAEFDALHDEMLSNSNAITFGALEAETAIPSYEWTFQARGRTWTGQILKSGFAGETVTVCAGSDARITWGDREGTFDDRIRASEIRFSLLDPDLVVYNDLIDPDLSEDDFSILLTDSTGTYTYRARIRLDEVSTIFVDDLEQHVTRIYGYCGMAQMRNIDAVVLTSSTIHNLFRLCLVSNAIGQDIEYYSAHYAENVAASGALLDLMRLNRLDLIFAEEGRKIDTMYDQMRGLLEGFGLFAMNGLDGKWHVKNEYALGETRTDRGAQYYTHLTALMTTLTTLTGNIEVLTNRTLSRVTRRRPVQAVQAVQVDRGNGREFFTVDLVKHGDFENGWATSSSHEVWTTVEGTYSRSTNADTGTYSFRLNSGSARADQPLLRFAGGYQDIDVEVALRYALESTTASTAKTGTSFLVLFYENPTTLDAARGDAGGDWTTDPLNGAIPLTAGIVANGSGLSWVTLVTTIYGPLPEYDGRLKISLQGALTNFYSYFDTLEVRLKRREDAVMDFRAVSGRYNLDGDLIGKGRVIEQSVPWYNGLLGIDAADDGTRDSVNAMVQVLTTSAGDWVQASDFKSLTLGYTTSDYPDLFELTSEVRINQQFRTTEQIEGEVLGIVPPDYLLQYNTRRYIQVYTEIDLRREVTSFVAHEKLTAQDAAPTTMYWADADDQIRKATILDTAPWVASTITTISAGRTIFHMRVDQEAGYIFTLELSDSTSNRYIVRRSLDGSGATDIITDSSDLFFNFTIARKSQVIYLIEDNPGGTGTAQISKYDYEGNSLGIAYYDSAASKLQWVAVNPAETHIYYRRERSGTGPFDEVKSRNIMDTTEVTLDTSPALSISGEVNTGVVSDLENRLWVWGTLSGADETIVYYDLPNGGSESTYVSSATNYDGQGMAINHDQERIAYPGTGGDIFWNNFAATDEVKIIEGGVSSPRIVAIDFGYN